MFLRELSDNIVNEKELKNGIVNGDLECCSKQEFELFLNYNIKGKVFKRIDINEEKINIYTKCKNCHKIIPIYNSLINGYNNCFKKRTKEKIISKSFKCLKCNQNDFKVNIKLEYLEQKELERLNVSNVSNTFTWIWINATCNKCHKKYKNLVNDETA